jgi:DNA polymerase III delta subunit
MIILIHGTGLASISKKLSELKKDFDVLSIQEFSAKQIEFEQAVAQIATGGLFDEKRLVVLEDFDEKIDFSKIPNDEGVVVVIKLVKNLAANSVLLKKATELRVQVFNFTEAGETNIFPFLDNLADKKEIAMKQLEDYLDEWGGQYVLTMIFYMLRRMVQNPKKLPPFVQQKIAKQKQNFPLEKIKELYKAGLETDFKIKSGLMEERIGLTLFVDKILII